METKKWYMSKVLWFNVLSAIVLIANAFGFVGFTPSPETNDLAMFIILGVNITLRFITKVPIK